MDSVPLVCISGQVPTHLIGTDAFQECDTTGITRPCTKHNWLVKDINDLPRIMHEAFEVATTGRPVETTNFHPGQSARAGIRNQLISSDALKVTERFTRVSDQGIKYEFSMHDPAVYSEVWRAEIPMRKSTDTIYEYACHEGNYAMPGILAGARLAEEEGRAGGFMETLATWIGEY